MTTYSSPVKARGPVGRTERSLAPDLARGAMLLFIALANASNFAFAGQPGLETAPRGLERVVNLVMLLFVDSRAYPVFAVMFGYGLVQIARRQAAAGLDERPVLLRRNAWLVGFGVVHATLLYFGDFLGAYGLVGLACTFLLVRRSDRFHRIVLWLWAVQLAYAGVLGLLFLAGAHGGSAGLTNSPNDSLAAPSYAASMLDRLQEWPLHTATVLPFIIIVWLGIWAGRRGVLEQPGRHLTLLRSVAAGGLGISVLGGLPYALVGAGWLHLDAGSVHAAMLVHAVTGEYAGPGYIALIALVAHRLGTPARTGMTRPVAALGQRSLSGYLFQSVAWLLVFSPWALDLGGSTLVAFTMAVGVWLISIVAARAMDDAGYRGPAETVLRRLTYGRALTR